MEDITSTPVANSVSFLSLKSTDISPFVKKAICKVLYIGENRNGSVITKEVATQMGTSMRACPVVGHYIKEKKDLGGHDTEIRLKSNGEIEEINECIPYGFVPSDAKVWFQDFEDTNELNETTKRTYLLTECLLWINSFPEFNEMLENDKIGQSMELENVDGHWTQSINQNREFFIIEHADIARLTMLGTEVTPCFEGASIRVNFSNNDENVFSLQKMIEQYSNFYSINKANNTNGGEKSMDQELKSLQDKFNALTQDKAKLDAEYATKVAENETANTKYQAVEKELNEIKEKFEALTKEHEELKTNYSNLETEKNSLVEENTKLKEFQNKITEQAKQDMIDSFSTLTEEDKKDVIENKANYSLEEIESKLSIIFTRKAKENKAPAAENKNDNKIVTAFGLNTNEDNIPALAKALATNRK